MKTRGAVSWPKTPMTLAMACSGSMDDDTVKAVPSPWLTPPKLDAAAGRADEEMSPNSADTLRVEEARGAVTPDDAVAAAPLAAPPPSFILENPGSDDRRLDSCEDADPEAVSAALALLTDERSASCSSSSGSSSCKGRRTRDHDAKRARLMQDFLLSPLRCRVG